MWLYFRRALLSRAAGIPVRGIRLPTRNARNVTIRSEFRLSHPAVLSRESSVSDIVQSQSASIDEEVIYQAQTVSEDALLPGMFEGWERVRHSHRVCNKIGDRIFGLCVSHAEGTADLKLAFGLPEGNPLHPCVFTGELFLLVLHVWLIIRRLKLYAQEILNGRKNRLGIAPEDVEGAISGSLHAHTLDRLMPIETSSAIAKKQVTQLLGNYMVMWHRLDEAICHPRGDELMAAALYSRAQLAMHWRDEVWELRHVRRLVEYLRFQMCLLDRLDVETLYGGMWHWVSPSDTRAFPDMSAQLMVEREAETLDQTAVDALHHQLNQKSSPR